MSDESLLQPSPLRDVPSLTAGDTVMYDHDTLTLMTQVANLTQERDELNHWKRIVIGTGTDQEAVIRLAATEYTKTAIQCWREKVDELTQQLATAQARIAELEAVCRAALEWYGPRLSPSEEGRICKQFIRVLTPPKEQP